MKRSRHIVAVVVLFMVGLSIAPSQATIVYDSGGFESPRFTAGLPLENQDGGLWVRTGTASASQVQIAVIESGNQAVQITRRTKRGHSVGRAHDWFPSLADGPDLN